MVELSEQRLVTGGPDPDKVTDLLESMRSNRGGRALIDAELFASLPRRLKSVVHVGSLDDDPADDPADDQD